MSAAPHTVPVSSPEVDRPPVLEPRPQGRSWKWLILLGILIIGAIVVWRMTVASKEVERTVATQISIQTATATAGPLQRTIRVAGQTSAIDFSNITAPIMRGREGSGEMILLYLVPGGSWVKKGAMVAQIDTQSQQDHVDDMADTIAAAESDIRKRRAEQSIEWENLQQSLRVTKSDLDKARLESKAAEVLTDIQQQLAKLTLDEAEARYKQQQSDLAQKRVAHAAEIKILEITLSRHQQHRDRHVRDIKAFKMYASMDGLAVMQQTFRGSEFGQIQQGDRVSPGQSFMKIVNTKTMQVEGSVNQAESGNFRVGQKALIKLDAFPGMQFAGKVYSIGALAVGGYRQSQYIRTVPVRVAIEGSDPRLIPDLSASADVTIESAENQVIVPLSAIKSEGGKPVLYVKAGDTFERRDIELGIQSDTQAAVTAGLKAGDVVRLN